MSTEQRSAALRPCWARAGGKILCQRSRSTTSGCGSRLGTISDTATRPRSRITSPVRATGHEQMTAKNAHRAEPLLNENPPIQVKEQRTPTGLNRRWAQGRPWQLERTLASECGRACERRRENAQVGRDPTCVGRHGIGHAAGTLAALTRRSAGARPGDSECGHACARRRRKHQEGRDPTCVGRHGIGHVTTTPPPDRRLPVNRAI